MIRILAIACAALCAFSVPAVAQQILAIGTNQTGSLLYSGGVAVSKVLDETLKRQARVQPYAGTSTFAPLLDRGEVDLGLMNVDDVATAFEGRADFAGRPHTHLRILAVLFPLNFGALVPADSPVKELRQLKGLRMPSEYKAMTTGRVLQEAVLATVGLSTADMQPVPVANLFQGVDAMAAGRVDAAVIAPGTTQVQVAHATLASRGGVRHVSLGDTPEGTAAMRKFIPARIITIEPAPHLPGVIGPTKMMAYSVYLVGNDKTDPALAYDLVKALHANKDSLLPV